MMLAKHTERLHTKTRDAVIYVSADINFERLMSTLLCPGRLVMRFVQMYNINNEKSSLSTPGFQEKTDLVFQLLMIMLTKKRKSNASPHQRSLQNVVPLLSQSVYFYCCEPSKGLKHNTKCSCELDSTDILTCRLK